MEGKNICKRKYLEETASKDLLQKASKDLLQKAKDLSRKTRQQGLVHERFIFYEIERGNDISEAQAQGILELPSS